MSLDDTIDENENTYSMITYKSLMKQDTLFQTMSNGEIDIKADDMYLAMLNAEISWSGDKTDKVNMYTSYVLYPEKTF